MSSSLLRLGLMAREFLPARTAGPKRIAAPYTRPMRRLQASRLPSVSPFTTSQSRPAGLVGRMTSATGQRDVQLSSMPSSKAQNSKKGYAMGELSSHVTSIVLPGTFVLPTLAQFPKPLGQKLRLVGTWLTVMAYEVLTRGVVKFASKPTIFSRARLPAKASTLIPTAKALHRSMAEALAAGDTATLHKICSRNLTTTLISSVEARPKGRRYGWELVRYTNKLFYPSVRSHKLSPMGREQDAPIVRQAVVAISSKQRRVMYDAQGREVPGSEKVIDVVENMTISCVIDPTTWQQTDWRIVGTVSPSTVEGWAEEKRKMNELLQQPQAKRTTRI